MQAELLIRARWVAPVDPAQLLDDHAVAVSAGRIEAILSAAEAERSIEAHETIRLDDHLLIPGLVNAHAHSAMTLLRGYADDLPLDAWLKERIWPAEARFADETFVRDGALAAAAEMLAGGTTTFADMYFFPEATIESALALGMRVVSGIVVIGFATRYAGEPGAYLERGLALRDACRANPLVSFMLAPHAPWSVNEETLRRIATIANETEMPIQTHLHETAEEIATSLAAQGRRPLARLAELGLTGPALAAVHMTQVNDEDLEGLSRDGVHVIHCPVSNLKLASGFCPVTRLLDAGVNVALGTDGAASSGDLDLILEMRTAALLAKGVAGDASALPAPLALHAATLGGARALGIDDRVGSLVPGKEADMTAIDFGAARLQPVYDPLSQLVYAASARDVSDVWVAGARRVENGVLQDLDESRLRSRLQQWGRRIAGAKDD
ncbi:MAG TPA: TRZ/ATZ family hydrolase [Gammaproteobacteria bacterium]|nr:TRZ/ATZ family hydrolase [Gammaproteobacteria bacterium]